MTNYMLTSLCIDLATFRLAMSLRVLLIHAAQYTLPLAASHAAIIFCTVPNVHLSQLVNYSSVVSACTEETKRRIHLQVA